MTEDASVDEISRIDRLVDDATRQVLTGSYKNLSYRRSRPLGPSKAPQETPTTPLGYHMKGAEIRSVALKILAVTQKSIPHAAIKLPTPYPHEKIKLVSHLSADLADRVIAAGKAK